ncbi:uncharacterized protein LOC111257665 [Setaria italica]|uniref:uncharacterized protein LOC111257665 n=1 Tax=Setaria italica TaxID=4555 RepID=UPI000BE508D1|nr:uncharacterized protein LOC111257665 [Setaria italica]
MRAVKPLNIYCSRAAVSLPLFLPPPVPLLSTTAAKQNSTTSEQLSSIPSVRTSAYIPPITPATCCSASSPQHLVSPPLLSAAAAPPALDPEAPEEDYWEFSEGPLESEEVFEFVPCEVNPSASANLFNDQEATQEAVEEETPKT